MSICSENWDVIILLSSQRIVLRLWLMLGYSLHVVGWTSRKMHAKVHILNASRACNTIIHAVHNNASAAANYFSSTSICTSHICSFAGLVSSRTANWNWYVKRHTGTIKILLEEECNTSHKHDIVNPPNDGFRKCNTTHAVAPDAELVQSSSHRHPLSHCLPIPTALEAVNL